MAEYVNTADILGSDIKVLDALVAHTLTEFTDDRIKSLRPQAFRYNDVIEKIDLAAPRFEGALINGQFADCIKLKHLIIRSSRMPNVGNGEGLLDNTAIHKKLGAIYVPSDMLNEYKSSSAFRKFLIFPIEDYPVTDFSTISDSWEEIIASINNGEYVTKYNIGDTKLLSIGNNSVLMKLVAKDLDELSDGSGNAKTTWIAYHEYAQHKMNETDTNSGGWPESAMRNYLIEEVLPQFPEIVRNNIKEVNKTYLLYGGTTATGTDTIWIPSCREIAPSNASSSNKESSGIVYDAGARAYRGYMSDGRDVTFWLRSATNNNATRFERVKANWQYDYGYASNSNYMQIGFCI